jgi:peroxiredoxin
MLPGEHIHDAGRQHVSFGGFLKVPDLASNTVYEYSEVMGCPKRRNKNRLVAVSVCMKMLSKTKASNLLLPLITSGLLVAMTPATAADVGDVAPNIEIATQDGEVKRLAEFRGRKPVYLVFWNTWCTYCIKKTTRYKKLQEQFGEKIEIIAINTSWGDSPEEMRLFEERFNTNYSMAFDFDELITDRYQVTTVPTEFIVDTNGVIRYRNSVPEYVVAHLPDWQVRSASSREMAQPVDTK